MRRFLLITEGTGGIEQHDSRTVRSQRDPSSKGRKTTEGIAGDHRRTADPLAHIGHQLIAPQGTPVIQTRRLGTSAEAQQINRMHGVGLGQHGNVVTPVIGGCSEPMHQQKRRAIGAVLLGMLLHRVHGVAEMAPGDAIHSRLRGTRC